MEQALSVRDLLTKEYVGVSESDTVLGAVKLMRDERASCVLVVRGSDPVGVMTEWDVLELVAAEDDPGETTVGDAMSSPVVTVNIDRSLADAAMMMARQNIRNVVVTDESGLCGVLTQRDVIAAAGSFQATTVPSEADPVPAGTVRGSDADEEPLPNGGDEYSTQGVCEACGSLADSLWESNGRLVCPDCRSV